jgi:hypothetical protein
LAALKSVNHEPFTVKTKTHIKHKQSNVMYQRVRVSTTKLNDCKKDDGCNEEMNVLSQAKYQFFPPPVWTQPLSQTLHVAVAAQPRARDVLPIDCEREFFQEEVL